MRICQIFIDKGYRIRYTLVYLLIALVYPVSNLLREGVLENFLSALAGYILPFYLYLFLFVLGFDILLLINRLLKLIPSEKLRTTHFKARGLSVILLLSTVVVVAGIINFNTIRSSEYKIDVPARSSDIKTLRIAFVADFHLNRKTNIRFIEKFAQKIKMLDPDLLLFGGDIVEGDRDDGDLTKYAQIINGINTRHGVFGVLGNHEHYAGQEQGDFFDKAGIVILSDTIEIINNQYNLAGRNDKHIRTRKHIGSILKTVTDSLPVIMIDHRPTEIDSVSKTKVDVQFSGHTHDGQLFPLNLIAKKIYILSYGYRKIENTHFFVTSGIQLWGPPVRTTGKSEIVVVDINFIP
jgi:predicted MPP superfamily phosphohydrolase